MKKLHIIITLTIIFAFALSGCINIKVTEKSGTTKVIDNDMNYTVTTQTNPKFLEEPTDEELNFYNSIDNAIKGCRIEDYTADYLKDSNVIKTTENDENILVFVAHRRELKDCISTFKLRKNVENNKTKYSEPIYAVGFAWKAKKRWSSQFSKTKEDNLVLEYTIISDLQGYNYLGNYNLEENSGDIKWGCTDDPKIKNLTINGQKPTEIIELKMDGDDVYFWYFENLEVDYDNIMDMEILY